MLETKIIMKTFEADYYVSAQSPVHLFTMLHTHTHIVDEIIAFI